MSSTRRRGKRADSFPAAERRQSTAGDLAADDGHRLPQQLVDLVGERDAASISPRRHTG
jgi:hypothetical protein